MRRLHAVALAAVVAAGCRPVTRPTHEASEAAAPAAITSGDLALLHLQGFDLGEFTRRADEVVVARVEQVESRHTVNAYGDRLITSVARLRVERALKGKLAAGEALPVEFLGGTVGDLTLTVSHLPAFVVGERAVVFVARGPTRRTVLGGDRGKLRLADGHLPDLGESLPALEKRISAELREGGAR